MHYVAPARVTATVEPRTVRLLALMALLLREPKAKSGR